MKTFAIITIAVWVAPQSFGFVLHSQLNKRIVGGSVARIEDFPYQLSFQYVDVHICGASILSARFALTSAYCTSITSFYHSVRAGTSTVGKGGQVLDVIEIYEHPFYNALTYNYDVSVLYLNSSLIFGSKIAVVSLQPIDQEPAVGSAAVVTGWGALGERKRYPLLLQKATVNQISRNICNLIYEGDISSHMICYGALNKDACQGDSGGPLVSNGSQIGIVSWGYGCARRLYPGVYTNIADREIHNHITLYAK